MKIFGSVLGVALCVAGTAYAQQLAVRSGDHPSFSRLTFAIPDSQGWEAEMTPGGIELRLAGFTRGFDTSEVFTRMQNNRILEIDAQADRLLLKVDCPCSATVFRSGPLLVLDVADNGTTLSGPPIVGGNSLQKRRPPIISGEAPRSGTLPWIGNRSPFGVAQRETGTPPPPIQTKQVEDRATLLTQVQQSLVDEIGRAASAGILQPDHKEHPVPSMARIDNKPELALKPEQLPETLTASSVNMRISSSREIEKDQSQTASLETGDGLQCPDEREFAVETWGDETDFSAQLGLARDALVDARDRLDDGAAKSLAQLYIYFGFGAEALSVLQLDDDYFEAYPVLVSLSTILERGAITGSNPLALYSDCDSSVALWATLGFQHVPTNQRVNSDAALRALNKLPKHLRQVLAPALSDRLLQYKRPAAAAAAMRSVERIGGRAMPDAMMSQANLVLEAGQPADNLLRDVIETNTTQSPEALIMLVNEKLVQSEPLSHETSALVEAYAQELRGTDLGNRLRQTQVIALSQSGQFAAAFNALDDLGPALSSDASNRLSQIVFEQLVSKADDLEFLEHVFAYPSKGIADLPVSTRLQIASRSTELGFAAQAQGIIATIPAEDRSRERQILAARIALRLQQPFQAQAALIGIDGPEIPLLLAQAKEMAGEYREASEMFLANDERSKASQAAWLSEDWASLIAPNAPDFGSVQTLVGNETSPNTNNLGMLGRAQSALEESSAARETLAQLLSNPTIRLDDN
jgi:hypothetical protein